MLTLQISNPSYMGLMSRLGGDVNYLSALVLHVTLDVGRLSTYTGFDWTRV